MHVAILNVNDQLFTAPSGDDAIVLKALGDDVARLSVIVATRAARPVTALADTVTLVPVPMRTRLDGLWAIQRAVIDLHRRVPIDIIQAQEPVFTGTAGMAAARRSGAPLIVGVFGTDPYDPAFARASPSHMAAAAVARAILKRATRVQTDSTVIADDLAARGLPVRYKPMTPANLGDFLSAGGDREHRETAERVLFVGRLGRQKRLDVLLRAFRIVRADRPAIRLDVVGDGPDREQLVATARELGLSDAVVFHGTVAQPQLVRRYLDADVLALTSSYEGMPRVFLEGGATGLPIVSTPVAGARELARVAPIALAGHSAPAFAAKLREMLDDRSLRAAAGAGLRVAIARRLDRPRPTEEQLAIWREVAR
jgi:glycosyltransferase involved in cell wall biosynthesis